jgi:protein tyrosine/serine phosphatase
MRRAFLSLALSGLCLLPTWADESMKGAVTAAEKPGEKIASEDLLLPNFHTVGQDSAGAKIYRSASPVRVLVKGKMVTPDDPEAAARAKQILEYIRSRGITTIVSLEDPIDDEKDGQKSVSVELERKAALSAGVAFHSHPMRNARFKDMEPRAILDWLKGVEADINASASTGSVLFHCAAGHDRTGLVAAYLRITADHWPVERAITEMRAMGHNWVKYSSNGGASSWHEDFLRHQLGAISGNVR